MKIIVLSENSPGENPELGFEHGLAIYVETNEKKILVDCGQTALFIQNARKLGLKIRDIDYLILTHGHYDHIGGLPYFLEANTNAKIIASKHIFQANYYSYRHKREKLIGYRFRLDNENLSRFIFVDSDYEISKGIRVIGKFQRKFPHPKSNSWLFAKKDGAFHQDNFDHEIALIIKDLEKSAIFTGCAHNGLLNILSATQPFCPQTTPDLVIGGFHLIGYKLEDRSETLADIQTIGEHLAQHYPNTDFFTGHCTHPDVVQDLKQVNGLKIQSIFTGKVIE